MLGLFAPVAAERPQVALLQSQATFQHVGWKARWDWQGAKTALEHLGLAVNVVSEAQLAATGSPANLLVLSNARNLEESTLQAVRQHLSQGGKVLASYQTSYRKANNSSWTPNGFALGPELGIRFTRWNGTQGETDALKVAPPYGAIPLARHQAMLFEPLPEAVVLAQWDKPAESASIVRFGNSLYCGEDLLAPENSQSRQVLGLMAGLLNSLEPSLGLKLPRTSPPLVEPQPPFMILPPTPSEPSLRVGLGSLLEGGQGAFVFSASKGLRDAQGKPLGSKLRIEFRAPNLLLVNGQKRKSLGPEFKLRGSPYLNCWQENSNGTMRWNAWRGSLHLTVKEQNVEAVNELPADNYLAGVIPSEVPFSFPPETLKAMAVVARTYALSHRGRHDGFDVCSEVHCQVYRGLGQEHPKTNQAILDTRGQFLLYAGQPANATFHACCGGHGVDVGGAWPTSAAVPYLEGSYDQPAASPKLDLKDENAFREWLLAAHPAFCSGAGRFRWQESFAWKDLESKLKVALSIEELKGLEVVRRDRSGRIQELKILALPADVVVGGDKVRWITSAGKVGAGGLQSSMFFLDIVGEGEARVVRLQGGGWGHGVGLCQEGAAGRARAGEGYRQILAHYYPGAQLTQNGTP